MKNNYKKIIDLTMPLEEGMQTFPVYWHPFFEVTQLGRHGIENRETRKIIIGTHTGTHIDAPRHIIPGGMTVDEIPNEWLVGQATILNLQDIKPRQEVELSIIKSRIDMKNPRILLLNYGWDKYLGTMSYYKDCPYLSKESAEWLVSIGCNVVGMDTPMPDNPEHGFNCPIDSSPQ